jgi:hypothetical protein
LLLGLALFGSGGVSVTGAAAALAIGVVGYGLSITLWVKGARDLGAARGQVIFSIAPFIGAAIAWTVLGEPASTTQILALLLASVGVALSLRTTHAHPHRHEAIEHEHEHSHDDGHHDHSHGEKVRGRHSHRHVHEPIEHEHPHYPDIHHDHTH